MIAMKTLTFYIEGITPDQDAELKRALIAVGLAHREAVEHGLLLLLSAKQRGEVELSWVDVKRQAERSVKIAFKATGFSGGLFNQYWGHMACSQFRKQWQDAVRGKGASVRLPAEASYLVMPLGYNHAVIEQINGAWQLSKFTLYGANGGGTNPRNLFAWKLVGQDRRRKGWTDNQAAQAKRLCAVRIKRGKREGEWLAQVTVEHEAAPTMVSQTDAPLWGGIDLGANTPVVLSVPDRSFARFIGRSEYSDLWDAIARYKAKRGRLYRAGQREASRDLAPALEAKRTHINELVSRQTVDWCISLKVSGIRMEKLTGLRVTGRLAHWPRYHLQLRIEQKAQAAGITVEYVRAWGTSQMCSRCGCRDRDFRSRAAFKCDMCGYEQHADLNAANNIARGQRAKQPRRLRLSGEGRDRAPRGIRPAGSDAAGTFPNPCAP